MWRLGDGVNMCLGGFVGVGWDGDWDEDEDGVGS